MRNSEELSNADFQLVLSQNENPGHSLRKILEIAIPFEPNSSSCFTTRIDEIIKAEGEFSYLLYQSSINYLVRRLISTVSYLKAEYDRTTEEKYEDFEERVLEPFTDKLRFYLRNVTRFEERLVERLIPILIRCLDIKNQGRVLNKVKKNKIRKRQTNENGELRCYICGCSLSANNLDVKDIIEHVWPKGLGGWNKESNLKVSCNRCTDNKQEYIDFSDFHYEEICIAEAEEEENFHKAFKRIYKVALWSKSNYSCTICGAKAEKVGRLIFKRRNLEDGWHFLNVDSYCESCGGFMIK
jgi:hypothetical protein